MELKTGTTPFIHTMGKRFGVEMYIDGDELIIRGTQENIFEILKEKWEIEMRKCAICQREVDEGKEDLIEECCRDCLENQEWC